MYSDLVQPGRAGRGLTKILSLALSGLLLITAALPSFSAWQDPLNSPAKLTQIAHQTLLLDVVRAERRLVAVGAHGHIIYSDDNGLSWTQGKVPVSSTLTAVYFASGDHGWAVGHDGIILATTDGGANWTKQFDGYQANDAIVIGTKANLERVEAIMAEVEASDDSIAIEEAEIALESATFGYEDALYDQESGSTKPFLDVWFYDAKRGYALGAYGMLFETLDSGATWVDASARLDNPDRLHLNSISMAGPESLVIVGEMGTLLRSDDLGKTWQRLYAPYDGSLFGLVAAGQQEFLFGLRGNVYFSADSGASWKAAETGNLQTLLGGAASDDQVVLVGNGGALVMVDANGNGRTITLNGRKAAASVAIASDGSLILAGEAGITRLTAQGDPLDQTISMAGDF